MEDIPLCTYYYYTIMEHLLMDTQGSAQDYLEVVKMGSDKHTYNIFQSNNIKCIVVVLSKNDKDH